MDINRVVGILFMIIGIIVLVYTFFAMSQPMYNTPAVFSGSTRRRNATVAVVIGGGLLLWGAMILLAN